LGGPILCRDQLEEWSASESTLFEDGVERCVKDFHDIRADFVSKRDRGFLRVPKSESRLWI